jgi:hypothetical protein
MSPALRFPEKDPCATESQFIIEVAVPPGVIVIWALIEIESNDDRNNK